MARILESVKLDPTMKEFHIVQDNILEAWVIRETDRFPHLIRVQLEHYRLAIKRRYQDWWDTKKVWNRYDPLNRNTITDPLNIPLPFQLRREIAEYFEFQNVEITRDIGDSLGFEW